MYCKNCGNQVDPNASVCLSCGVRIGDGINYCQNCGEPLAPNAAVCIKCGCAVTAGVAPGTPQKSKMVAGLLGIFLGSIGVHNFYLGYTAKAIIQLVITVITCGFGAVISGIWGFIEGILILCGKIDKDGKGVPLEN